MNQCIDRTVARRAASAALVALLAACGGGPTANGVDAAGEARLDLRALDDHARGVATSIREVTLRAEPETGAPREFARTLVPLPRSVSFDVRVPTGINRFTVEVLSTSGDVLYFGERVEDIRRNGFGVQVQVKQFRTVLCARPDTLRVDERGGDISLCQFVVPGTRPLEWSVQSVTPAIQLNQCTSPAVPCLTVVPSSGALRSEEDPPVISLRPTTATPRVPYTLRIGSPLGHVDVVVIPTAP